MIIGTHIKMNIKRRHNIFTLCDSISSFDINMVLFIVFINLIFDLFIYYKYIISMKAGT